MESLRISIEGKDKEISHLKDDADFKSSAIDKLFLEKESLNDKLLGSERALNEAKDEILSLKVHIAGISKDECTCLYLTGLQFQVKKRNRSQPSY